MVKMFMWESRRWVVLLLNVYNMKNVSSITKYLALYYRTTPVTPCFFVLSIIRRHCSYFYFLKSCIIVIIFSFQAIVNPRLRS
ncbi:hypothetical protein HanIR_Chr01g0043631 [Helianthus annuus]|nr:hypothetical protein HanIR_Chr01g0043631 [Helianthus annuus]